MVYYRKLICAYQVYDFRVTCERHVELLGGVAELACVGGIGDDERGGSLVEGFCRKLHLQLRQHFRDVDGGEGRTSETLLPEVVERDPDMNERRAVDDEIAVVESLGLLDRERFLVLHVEYPQIHVRQESLNRSGLSQSVITSSEMIFAGSVVFLTEF